MAAPRAAKNFSACSTRALSYLQRFEIDDLKIDRSFVSSMGSNRGENLEIVRTIVTLAKHLGMHAVAEGVETPGQLALLRELGCHRVQGFLFAGPVEGVEAGQLLATGRRWR